MIICANLFLHMPVSAEEPVFDFDVSKYQNAAFEFRGYAQFKSEFITTNESSALYQLRYVDDIYSSIEQYTGSVELSASYKKGMSSFFIRSYSSQEWDHLDEDKDEHSIYEGYLSLQPDPAFSLDIGKKVNRWGKGYAWNPVGFVERKKDPNDPELSREGYVIQSFDFIHSMEGDLKTIAFTPIVLPNHGDTNDDFGSPDHTNVAAKLYLLYRDTDIDFMVLNNGSKTARYGIDFAKNIIPQFEVHGEFAYITDAMRSPLTSACTADAKVIDDVSSYLLGMRYRTEDDVNYIVEYYNNGEGYTEKELRQYYSCVHQAWASGDLNLLDSLKAGGSLNTGAFTTQNPMQRYLTFKSWWIEPNDILYLVPGIQLFYNMDDGSYSVAPEISYTGIDNLQLRVRFQFFSGDALTEFGEKLSENKLEMRLRYYF